jgi:orotidine-5'-phosphate decarboxylase
MLEGARAALDRSGSALKLLAVTVLTSLDAADLAAIGVDRGPAEQARALARLARNAGAHGVVCSVHEARALRQELGTDALLVTPGIRPIAAADDQKRSGSVSDAIANGADLLVVGRPSRDAADPAGAARGIVDQIAEALASRRSP